MRQGLSRRTLGRSAIATIGSVTILRHARGEEALKIRCSLDTAPSHVRNVAIADYLAKLQDATGGRITSEIFASGQLYPDLNVGKALLQGQVDMAAPGGWTQTGIVPDCDFCQLPVFYGQPIEDVVAFVEDFAELGQYLRMPVKTYSSASRSRPPNTPPTASPGR